MPDTKKTRDRVDKANRDLKAFKEGKLLADPKVLRKELKEAIKEWES